jgi:hypothetical protein
MVPLQPWPWASAVVRDLLQVLAVGVLYATVFRLGNSALLIWPFFLAVGGVYDVLINSRVVAAIPHVEIRTLVLAVLYAVVAAWVWRRAGATAGRPARR